MDGYVQAIGVLLDQTSVDELDPATGEPLNATRVLIRRARLRGRATRRWAFGQVELDGNTTRGARVELQTAFAGVAWPQEAPEVGRWAIVEGRFGLLRVPFGHDLQASSQGRLFVERSQAARALFGSGLDLGVEVRGQWRFVRYQLAAVDGSPLGAADFAAQDPTASRDLLGRLGVVIPMGGGVQLEGGASLLQGEGLSPGTPSTKDSLQWVDANENGVVEISELQPVAGTAGRPSETFERSALGGDVEVAIELPGVGTLSVFGEVFWALDLDRGVLVADPVTLGRDQRELGFAAGLSQDLFGLGVLGLRYDRYDPDADASERRAAALVPLDRSVSTLSVVLGWTGFESFLFAVEYNANDNNLGRSASGEPARLEADRLLLRAQVDL